MCMADLRPGGRPILCRDEPDMRPSKHPCNKEHPMRLSDQHELPFDPPKGKASPKRPAMNGRVPPPDADEIRFRTVWIAVILQGLALLFMAGVAWDRISVAERDLRDVKSVQSLEHRDVRQLLMQLDGKLSSIDAKVDLILSIYGIGKKGKS